jgi:hypothetical protein
MVRQAHHERPRTVRQAHHERPLVLSLSPVDVAQGDPEALEGSKDAGFAFTVGLAILFLALHLPYLPTSLEDLDSINFALGVRQFDVAHHQPHPPGYPVFILIAKALHAVVPAEVTVLALVSVGSGALGVLALGALFRRLDGSGTPARWSLTAAGVAMTAPLYWFTAVRPLSDSSGLAAALTVQAMTLAASSARALALAAFAAGLAAGLRSQVVWLTVPLLALRAFKGLGTGDEGLAPSAKSLVPVVAAFLAGITLWLVPLVIVSGGPAAYWHALFDQGAEDLGNIQMLWTRHGARDVLDALYFAFVAPWAVWPVAAVALACAFFGLVRLVARQRQTLIVVGAAFLPYLVFDLLFQETFTSRYALPLVVPVAYLAVAGLRALPWDTGLAVAAALAMFCAHLGGTSIAAYANAAAPAFRLLDAFQTAARVDRVVPVLAMDRRESLDLRRPMKWMGTSMPDVSQTLPAPPQHEWLEAVKYWNGGGRAPVWFVVDPLRASIDLVQHGDPQRFRWTVPYPVLLSGARPNEMDWYRIDRPDWYVGEGWALTPEAAGVAHADQRGPSLAAIEGWIDSRALGHDMMIGGRNLDNASHPRLTVSIGGRPFVDQALNPGPFLIVRRLPADLVAPSDPRTYAKVTAQATSGSRVAIEQFDTSATRALTGFGEGWHEQELDPRSGVRWRWLSERGELEVVPNVKLRAVDWVDDEPLMLHLEGESSRKYFSRDSVLTVRSGDQRLLTMPITEDFSVDIPITRLPIVLETDQVFSPADRSRRSADRRHLGLRIFKAEVRKASRPAS